MKIYLNKKDIQKISDILEKFPGVTYFVLEQDSSSGIGSITRLTIDTSVNGVDGQFVTEIAGVEEW